MKTQVQLLERDLIVDALKCSGGNMAAAARELGIHRTTLQRKIRRLGLQLPPEDGRSRRPDDAN